jgi:hypothetical protein
LPKSDEAHARDDLKQAKIYILSYDEHKQIIGSRPCLLRDRPIWRLDKGIRTNKKIFFVEVRQTKASSILGIILADFRFFLRGLYTKVDTTPAKRIENRFKRTPKSTEA